MTIKKVAEGSGVTRHERDYLCSPVTREDFAYLKQLAVPGHVKAEAWAREVLAEAGIERSSEELPGGGFVGGWSAVARGRGFAEDSPEDFAGRIMDQMRYVNAAIERGDAAMAARFAFNAGQIAAFAGLKFEWEPAALRGEKVGDAAAEGGRQRWAGSGWKARAAELQAAVERKHDERPYLSYSRIREIVADEFGCSAETVKRHTRNPAR